MTLDELYTRVRAMLNDESPEFIAYLPRIVRQAEDRISEVIETPASLAEVAGTLTTGSRSLGVPADLRSVNALFVTVAGARQSLRPVQFDMLSAAFPDFTATGTPRVYAYSGESTLALAPAPGSALPYTLMYERKPASLVDNPFGPGTWMSQRMTNALFWAAIVEGYTYLKGDEKQMAAYEARFSEAMAQAQLLADVRIKSDKLRDGDARVRKPSGG